MEETTVYISVSPGEKLGMRINNNNVVIAVHEGTPAHRAAIKEEDVVVSVDGRAGWVELGSGLLFLFVAFVFC